MGGRWRPTLLAVVVAVLTLGPAGIASADHPCGPAPSSRHLTSDADTEMMGPGTNWIHALSGDDVLYGGGGADRVCGDNGGDTIIGQGGDDYLEGGDGWHDDLAGESGHDQLLGKRGTDRIYGGNGDDSIYAGEGDDFVFDGYGRDDLYGGPGYDVLVLCDDGLKEAAIEGFEDQVRGPGGCRNLYGL